MPDGARLPYRAWLPEGPPRAVVLALHGFNDSRDAWEDPGAGVRRRRDWRCMRPTSAASARPPGEACGRGPPRWWRTRPRWRGWCARCHPGVPLVLMGESMGAAVLMVLATGPLAPAGAPATC